MNCDDIDDKKAKEAIERTKETGNEHGFIQCSDGDTGEMLQGDDDSMEIQGSCSSGSMGVYHTHPNNNPRLSDADREVLHRDDVDMVCVGVEDNGEKKMHCERSMPSCVSTLNQAELEGPEASEDELPGEAYSALRQAWQGYEIALRDGETEKAKQFAAIINGIRAGHGLEPLEFERLDGFKGVDLNQSELEALPKGSSCVDWKKVPSPSSYFDSDSVDRCAHYDTGDKKKEDVWPSGTNGWKRTGENRWDMPNYEGGKYELVPEKRRRGGIYVNVAKRKGSNQWVPSKFDSEQEAAKWVGKFMETYSPGDVNLARFRRDGVDFDDSDDEEIEIPREVGDYKAKSRGNKWEAIWQTTGKVPGLNIKVPREFDVHHSVEVKTADKQGGSTYVTNVTAYHEWDGGSHQTAIGTFRRMDRKESFKIGVKNAVEWMEEYQPVEPGDEEETTVPDRIGRFNLTEEGELTAEYKAQGRFTSGAPASLPRDKPLTVTVRIIESRGAGYVDARYWIGGKDGTPDEQKRIAERQGFGNEKKAFKKAMDAAIEWMSENQPTDKKEDEKDESGDPYEVEFGTLDAANLARDFADEHLHENDKRNSKTVTLVAETPDDVLNNVAGMAADSNEHKSEKFGQVPLTDSEKKRIDFTETSVPHARSSKAIALGKGVDDWLAFYDTSLSVDEHRDVYEAAAQDERGRRLDPDDDSDQDKRYSDAYKRQQSEQCDNAAKFCGEECDDDACDFIRENCSYTEAEIQDMTSLCTAELAQPDARIEAPDHTGKQRTIDLNKPTVVWMFPNADGCRCGAHAKQFEEHRDDEMQVVGVNTHPPEANKHFADKLGLSYPILSDPDGKIPDSLGLELKNGHAPRATAMFNDGKLLDVIEGPYGSENVAKKSLNSVKGELAQSKPCPMQLAQAEDDVLAHFEHPSVVTITGQRRAGKSSLSYRIAERLHKEQNVQPVTVGLPKETQQALPDDWIHVDSIHEAPTDSVVVYDEAYRNLNAREPMSDENLDLAEVVQTSAQRGQTLLFVTQNSAILDKVAVGESDAILMKKPGKIQMEFERSQLRKLSQKARERFEKMPADLQEEAYTYVFAEDSEAFVSNEEASFYNDKISHSFRSPCDLNQPEESNCPFSNL